jgi:hypothetical protein
MDKNITLIVNGKEYPTSYGLEGKTYRVKTDHEDLYPHVTNEFSFFIKDGKARYLGVSKKTHEIAQQIIEQINANELKH